MNLQLNKVIYYSGLLVLTLLYTIAFFFSFCQCLMQHQLLSASYGLRNFGNLPPGAFKPAFVAINTWLLTLFTFLIFRKSAQMLYIMRIRAMRGYTIEKKEVQMWASICVIWHLFVFGMTYFLTNIMMDIKQKHIFEKILGEHNEEPYFKSMAITLISALLASSCECVFLLAGYIKLHPYTEQRAYIRV